MIGAFIGDLAAWTWEHEHIKFYPQLFSDGAQKSEYSDSMLLTAKYLLQYPTITREEFMRIHNSYFEVENAKANAEYDLLRAIVIGWMYDADEISSAIHKFCILDDKEELYASHFLAHLIYRLRTGFTKKDAAQVDFC